jgi:hypothetical protein
VSNLPAIHSQLELPADIDRTFDGICLELVKRGAEVDLNTSNYPVHALGQPQPIRYEFSFGARVRLPTYHGTRRFEAIAEGRGSTPLDALVSALWNAHNNQYDRIDGVCPSWFDNPQF